mmetsp:Transcript_98125/g.120175  ORF Transcript_98125/g.120175 Transcript_98125/m.120175 type:complete len:483 (-) Transcript_98125:41-1489(-)
MKMFAKILFIGGVVYGQNNTANMTCNYGTTSRQLIGTCNWGYYDGDLFSYIAECETNNSNSNITFNYYSGKNCQGSVTSTVLSTEMGECSNEYACDYTIAEVTTNCNDDDDFNLNQYTKVLGCIDTELYDIKYNCNETSIYYDVFSSLDGSCTGSYIRTTEYTIQDCMLNSTQSTAIYCNNTWYGDRIEVESPTMSPTVWVTTQEPTVSTTQNPNIDITCDYTLPSGYITDLCIDYIDNGNKQSLKYMCDQATSNSTISAVYYSGYDCAGTSIGTQSIEDETGVCNSVDTCGYAITESYTNCDNPNNNNFGFYSKPWVINKCISGVASNFIYKCDSDGIYRVNYWSNSNTCLETDVITIDKVYSAETCDSNSGNGYGLYCNDVWYNKISKTPEPTPQPTITPQPTTPQPTAPQPTTPQPTTPTPTMGTTTSTTTTSSTTAANDETTTTTTTAATTTTAGSGVINSYNIITIIITLLFTFILN